MSIVGLRTAAMAVSLLAFTADPVQACRRSPNPAMMMSRQWLAVAVVRIGEVEADDGDPALHWSASSERVGLVEGEDAPRVITLEHRELPNCRELRAVPQSGEYWVVYLATFEEGNASTAYAWPLDQARAIDPRFSAEGPR